MNLKNKATEAKANNNVGDSPIINALAHAPKHGDQVISNQAPVVEELQKIVQTKISIADYQRLMNIKVKRNQKLMSLVNEAIVYWLDHQ